MESKLEPIVTRVPYQLTITLNEEEIEGLRHFFGSFSASTSEVKGRIKSSYKHLTDKQVETAWMIQLDIFDKCADAVDFIYAEKKRNGS